jgi:hypothetical protein
MIGCWNGKKTDFIGLPIPHIGNETDCGSGAFEGDRPFQNPQYFPNFPSIQI